MGLVKVPQKRNPYANVGNIVLTVGTEGSNIINVAGKLTGVSGRTAVECWFSKDAYGAVPLRGIFMPESGYAVGTNGTIFPGPLDADRIYPTAGLLAIDAVPEKFKLITNTVTFYVGGAAFTKAPATAIAFSAAHVVTANKFGIVLVQVNQAGTVSTKVPAATPTTAMAYTTAALARAALPSPDALNVALGYIAIDALTGTAWTATTDDLTNAGDVDTATFVNAPANGLYPNRFTVLSTTAGLFDINITDTRVLVPMYLCVRNPTTGLVTVSSPITFA